MCLVPNFGGAYYFSLQYQGDCECYFNQALAEYHC